MKMPVRWVGLAALLLAAVGLAQDSEPQPTPPLDRAPVQPRINEQARAAASNNLKEGRYAEAITNADHCIERFRKTAEDMEAGLEAKNESLGTGTVSPKEKVLIAKNGILNDVASCLLIKGEALEKLSRPEEAAQSYKEAAKYRYARASDASGEVFWAPADAASQRLISLKSSSKKQ